MLWILSGSYHSGKNTVRDILAEKYGFKIISKSVLKDTAQDCFEEINTYGQKELRAKRDPYLVVINNEEDKQYLLEMKAAKDDVDKERHVKEQIARAGRIIYDKALVDYYFIYIEDLRRAVAATDNYLLVCSDPDVIEQILKVEEVSEGRSDGKVKTIMIFGINLDSKDYGNKNVLENRLNMSTNKIKDFFKNRQYLQRFDHIIFNRPYDNFDEREENIMSQFELAISNSNIDHSFKPIRLFTQKDNNNEVKSNVFFVKPFSGEEDGTKSRAQIVYDEINQIAKKCDRTVQYIYNDKHPNNNYFLGGDTPIKTVEYNNPDYPQDQMKKQIEDSELIVVDVADIIDGKFTHKPNCYWELGYARAKNKQVYIICDQEAFPLPFDENTIAFSYSITNEKINMNSTTTGMTFDNELNKYFNRLKQAVNNRNYHKYLMSKCKK